MATEQMEFTVEKGDDITLSVTPSGDDLTGITYHWLREERQSGGYYTSTGVVDTADPTFKVENIVGIFLEQKEILVQCVSDMVADGGLHVPVPLRVEMCVSDHVGLHCLLLGMDTQC